MQFRVSAYWVRRDQLHALSPLCGGVFPWTTFSRDASKARERTIERLRKELPRLDRALVPRIDAVQGRKLERLRLEFNVRGEEGKRHVTGFFPIVTEPRLAAADRLITIAYHPARAADWFEVDPDQPLADQAANLYARIFAEDVDFLRLRAEAQDKLVTLSFNADAPSLLDLLKSKDEDRRVTLGGSGDLGALLRTSVNQTARAAEGRLDGGMPRSPYRERLSGLLAGDEKTSVLLVGPPGCGKSTLIAQATIDLLAAENFASHRNLDRVHNVWRLQGRHLIAGMSYVGQWEARCVALLERARSRRTMLWVDDLYAWTRLGRSTASERSLSDFFRAPLARRSLTMIAEVTAEQLAVLERDAPAFTSSFARVYVEPSTAEDTLSMMLYEGRRLESELEIAFDPRSYAKVCELSSALLSSSAFPGKALEPLKTLAQECAARPQSSEEEPERSATPDDVVALFSRQTGLPEVLLSAEQPLQRGELYGELEQQIMGQPAALGAACDLILSIRAGLCARGRPYGVYLFTGPTGTGKTELAKCIAEYLYGDGDRLVRFDMGELNTPLATERLIGGYSEPDGQLTRAVRAQPFCVLLFDEIEKAHPSVLNLLLQLLDDGRLTDASGSVADFTHTVVIMTSNLGADARRVSGFAEDASAVSADIARAIREFFPPELFNRIDRVVPFAPLTREHAESIARKELGKLAARPGLAERNIFLRFSEGVVRRVALEGYRPEYGARALKRFIDKEIGNLVTAALTAETAAELRLFYLHVGSDGRLTVRSEALREHSPVADPSQIEALLNERGRALIERVPAALGFLHADDTERRLEQFSERLSAALAGFRSGDQRRASDVFNLDTLRNHVTELAKRLEHCLAVDERLQEQERVRKRALDEEVDAEDYSSLGDAFHRAHAYEHEARARRPTARALLADLVEARFLERALEGAHELANHAVLIELVRVGEISERRRFSGGNPGLLEWLAPAYATARGALEQAAVAFADGRVERAATPAELDELLRQRPRAVALLQLGPSVKRFFVGETGCHVRRTPLSGPEIVRLRVLPLADPAEHLRRHELSRREFESALESAGDLPENPESLLPIVRSLRFEPEPGKLTQATVEDFRLAYFRERRARDIGDLLGDVWLLCAGALPS